MPTLRVLSRADLQAALDMPAAITAVRQAFAQLALGEAQVPLRSALNFAPDAVALVMPAYLAASGGLGLKVVTVTPANSARGLPLIHALVVVLDAETGAPIAALEGGWLTALRTGAASGAATDMLARHDAETLAVFGAGAQGETQALAACAVRQIRRVRLYDKTPGKAEALAARLAGLPGIPSDVAVAPDPASAVADADIVCTATTSPTPVFPGDILRPGTHVNAVGAFTLTARELDEAVVARARIVVDERNAAIAEAGDLVIPWQAGEAVGPEEWTELGAIAAGLEPGRQHADEITLFKSVGNAVQDVAVAALAVARAADRSLGTLVPL
ncbi:MAG: ornithine cyclodeaminase [Anaerolineae bacterium]